jgi:alkanesulfonate monooxygenase
VEVEFNWHIPCAGDSHWMQTRMPERAPHVNYLTQVAQAAEYAGFDRVLVPCAFSNSTYSLEAPYVDSWTLGTACMGATRKLEILIAHRPGFVNPGVFAQMCATADDYCGGRLALNIVTAGAPGDMEQFGDVLDHDARYRRASEFVTILKSLWTEQLTNFDGEFYRMHNAQMVLKPVQPGGPRFFLAGASEAAIDMAAKQADVYMMSASTVQNIAERVDDLRRRAAEYGRSLRFCVAGTLFSAETDDDARAWAVDFANHADLEVVAERTAHGRQTTAVEDIRARAGTNLHTWISPNIWSGIAHLNYGAAWVGSYTGIADLFEEYADAGVSIFQIYGYPFLEEAYHVGARLLPVVKARFAKRGVLV